MGDDIALVIRVFQTVDSSGFDFVAALKAIESGDAETILPYAEQALQIAGDLGVPYASDARLGLIILGLIIHGYKTGLIKSGQPEDPSMEHAQGKASSGSTPGLHTAPVVVAGADPSDPYDFEHKGPPT